MPGAGVQFPVVLLHFLPQGVHLFLRHPVILRNGEMESKGFTESKEPREILEKISEKAWRERGKWAPLRAAPEIGLVGAPFAGGPWQFAFVPVWEYLRAAALPPEARRPARHRCGSAPSKAGPATWEEARAPPGAGWLRPGNTQSVLNKHPSGAMTVVTPGLVSYLKI